MIIDYICVIGINTRRLARGVVYGNGKHVSVGSALLHITHDIWELRSVQPACRNFGRRFFRSGRGQFIPNTDVNRRCRGLKFCLLYTSDAADE